MAIKPAAKIWFNGKIVPWEQATVHVMSHALHYGSSVFEGIRAYDTPKGTVIFRLSPHVRRLFDSARMYRMEIPYTRDDIASAVKASVRENHFKSAYVRPIVYRGFGGLAPAASADTPIEVAVAAIDWGQMLGADAIEHGIDVCVSSWARPAPNTMPGMAKAGGNYLSSQLITMEAQRHGYVEGIGLDTSGYLSEGGGENLFLVRDNVIMTPPLSAAILAGVTRDAVIQLAKRLGYEVKEQTLPREALYVCDEAFFTGTAAEITPIRSIDQVSVGNGKRGPVTSALQKAFFGLFRGETPDDGGWLEPV